MTVVNKKDLHTQRARRRFRSESLLGSVAEYEGNEIVIDSCEEAFVGLE